MKKTALAALLALFVLPFGYLLALSLATEWRFPHLLPVGWTTAHWTDLGSTGGNWAASAITSLLLVCRLTMRAFFVGRIYGLGQALL